MRKSRSVFAINWAKGPGKSTFFKMQKEIDKLSAEIKRLRELCALQFVVVPHTIFDDEGKKLCKGFILKAISSEGKGKP